MQNRAHALAVALAASPAAVRRSNAAARGPAARRAGIRARVRCVAPARVPLALALPVRGPGQLAPERRVPAVLVRVVTGAHPVALARGPAAVPVPAPAIPAAAQPRVFRSIGSGWRRTPGPRSTRFQLRVPSQRRTPRQTPELACGSIEPPQNPLRSPSAIVRGRCFYRRPRLASGPDHRGVATS